MLASRITPSPDRDRHLERAFEERAQWAYDEAYRRFGALLRRYASRMLRDTQAAEDCIHDVMLHLWHRGDAYRTDRGSLEAFLLSCVRNDALTRLRNDRRHAERLRSVDVQQSYDVDVDPIEARRIAQALERLDARQRHVIERAYFGGLTHREIAESSGTPLGTVKTRLSAGLRTLRAALITEENDG